MWWCRGESNSREGKKGSYVVAATDGSKQTSAPSARNEGHGRAAPGFWGLRCFVVLLPLQAPPDEHEHAASPATAVRTLRTPLAPLAMSNDAPSPISDDEVVALAKAAFEQSRDDINHRAAETPAAPNNLQAQQPGITIDLGHKNIARLPDEVIDVIRAEIERCAPSPPLLQSPLYHVLKANLPGSLSRTTSCPPSRRV